MEAFVGKAKNVAIDALFLDANNPRLAFKLEDRPGYANVKTLFDKPRQAALQKRVEAHYDVAGLQTAVESQGWMPIDNIVVWEHPKAPGKFVVVEGNTRVVTLRKVRERLGREREKFEKMSGGRKHFAQTDLKRQQKTIADLQQIVADTNQLSVVPLIAATVEELERKLPRVLAVRHVTGMKPWGSYAEDLWLLIRFETLFEGSHGQADLFWDQAVIGRVANEAAISPLLARRKILAASCFSHFRMRFDDSLPEGEEFGAGDYYLFENIIKKPWLREQFGLVEGLMYLPEEREDVLFQWVFAQPRGRTADDNPNVFYRHENVLIWERMHRYDDLHKTGFAARFDVEEPDLAPRMAEVEAAWLVHKESRQPADIIEQLLQQLKRLDTNTLVSEGTFLIEQLKKLHSHTGIVIRMIDAARNAA